MRRAASPSVATSATKYATVSAKAFAAILLAILFGTAALFGPQLALGATASNHNSATSSGSRIAAQSLSTGTLATQASASSNWGYDSIFAGEAQSYLASQPSREKVAVAILDTGFYVKHPALNGKIAATWDAAATMPTGSKDYPEQGLKSDIEYLKGETDVAPVNATGSTESDQNHGTHVAGIVSSIAPDAKLVLIRIADDENGEIYKAALYNAYSLIRAYNNDSSNEYKIRVVNFSGGSYQSESPNLSEEEAFVQSCLDDQIDDALAEGIVTVCSAGNEAKKYGSYYNYPADNDNVVSVMSLEQTQSGNPHAVKRDANSNYNASGQKTKDICAPGKSIYSAIGTSSYGLMSGTSMAAPHVSATLALMFATGKYTASGDATQGASGQASTGQGTSTQVTPAQALATQAINDLYASATKIGDVDDGGWSQNYGWGEVNARAAVCAGGSIAGSGAITNGSTQDYLAAPPQVGATANYTWKIASGADLATITDSSTNSAGSHITVRAKHCGTIALAVTVSSGGKSYFATRTITISGSDIKGPESVPVGFSDTYSVTGSTGAWTWSSSNTSIASVNSQTGIVSGKKLGKVTLMATSGDQMLEKTITVAPVDFSKIGSSGYPVTDDDIKAKYYTVTYTGSALKPKVEIALKGTTLVNGTDYSVSCANNVNAGTRATFTITGKSAKYTGSRTYLFGISPAKLSASSVSLSASGLVYNGAAKKPAVKVKNGARVLSAGKDYTVKYANNVAAGTAKVTVTGKGNYTGTATVSFTIGKANNQMWVKALTKTVKYSKVKKKQQTLARPVSVSKAQGTITFVKKSGNKKITVNKKTGKVTVKKGLKKGRYKVKIAVTAAGNANYKATTKVVAATIRVK